MENTRPPIFKTDEEEAAFLQPAFDDVDAGRTISHEELKRSIDEYIAKKSNDCGVSTMTRPPIFKTDEEEAEFLQPAFDDVDAGRVYTDEEMDKFLEELFAKDAAKAA